MEGVNGSLNFIIDKDIANLVKNHKPRVNHLFGVTVKLEKPQKDKQWINIKGSEDQLYKAKVKRKNKSILLFLFSLQNLKCNNCLTYCRFGPNHRSCCFNCLGKAIYLHFPQLNWLQNGYIIFKQAIEMCIVAKIFA